MKASCRKKSVTFGEFVAEVYDACGERQARGLVRLALKAHLIQFLGQPRLEIEDVSPAVKR